MKNKLVFILVLLLSSVSYAEERTKIKIVATTGMIADLVQNIVGEGAEVKSLMGTGVDPHLYKPSRTDISLLTSADVVFYNGLHLEGRMLDAIERLKVAGKRVIGIGDLLPKEDLISPDGSGLSYDPHIWMDPVLWKKSAEIVKVKLSEIYPDMSLVYKKNLDLYILELDKLDSYIETTISSIPTNSRILITAHDAFSYFGKRYGLRVLGIQGISTESESGLKEIEELVSTIIKEKIPAIFYETTVSEKSISALMEGVNKSGGSVRIAGSVFSDAMGEAKSYRGTYIGMLDHNVTEIGLALGVGTNRAGMKGAL
jgi:manganese/zinc/iron transport system substrate-binding protein